MDTATITGVTGGVLPPMCLTMGNGLWFSADQRPVSTFCVMMAQAPWLKSSLFRFLADAWNTSNHGFLKMANTFSLRFERVFSMGLSEVRSSPRMAFAQRASGYSCLGRIEDLDGDARPDLTDRGRPAGW